LFTAEEEEEQTSLSPLCKIAIFELLTYRYVKQKGGVFVRLGVTFVMDNNTKGILENTIISRYQIPCPEANT